MGFANSEQLRELFLCGGMGFLLGLYYDGFRLLRLWFSSQAVVFSLDCLYCITAAMAVYLFSLAVTDGQLRLFLFVGLLAGFCSYRYTVGRLILRAATRFRRMIFRFFRLLRAKTQSFATKIKNQIKKPQKNQKKS